MADCYLGEIRLMAGPAIPRGWHACDGSLLPINGNEALYAILGATYGGDARTNFGLPDLQGRLPIGLGQGTGMTQRVLGSKGGVETVALTQANLPPHTHTVNTSGAAATTTTPAADLMLANTTAPVVQYVNRGSAATSPTALSDASITSEGTGAAHNNLMPNLPMRYIIALTGNFPVSDN